MAVNVKKKVTLFTDSELKWHGNIDYRVDDERTLSFNKDKVTMFVNGAPNVINEANYASDLITDSTYTKYDIVPSDVVVMTIIFKLGICSIVDVRRISDYLNAVHDKVMVGKDFESRIINLCKCGLCFCYRFKDIYGGNKELYSLTRAGNSFVYHQNSKLSASGGAFSNRYDADFSFYNLYEKLKYAEASKAISTLIRYYKDGVKYKVNSNFYDKVTRESHVTYGFFNATVDDVEKYIVIEPWKVSYDECTFVNETVRGDFVSYSTYADKRIRALKRIIQSQPSKYQDGTNDNFKVLFVCEDEGSVEDLLYRLDAFENNEKETVLVTSSYIFSAVNILENKIFYRFEDSELVNCPFCIDFVNKVL
jgi:hypothetical protein